VINGRQKGPPFLIPMFYVLDSGWHGSKYNNDSKDEANSEEY
jgi:hypothetical protein